MNKCPPLDPYSRISLGPYCGSGGGWFLMTLPQSSWARYTCMLLERLHWEFLLKMCFMVRIVHSGRSGTQKTMPPTQVQRNASEPHVMSTSVLCCVVYSSLIGFTSCFVKVLQVPWIFHFAPSLDALSLHSDVIDSIKILCCSTRSQSQPSGGYLLRPDSTPIP